LDHAIFDPSNYGTVARCYALHSWGFDNEFGIQSLDPFSKLVKHLSIILDQVIDGCLGQILREELEDREDLSAKVRSAVRLLETLTISYEEISVAIKPDLQAIQVCQILFLYPLLPGKIK
jgi:hypothetical protein